MQKILRRVATAERVVAKRTKTKDLKWFKKQKKETFRDQQQQLGMVRENLNDAKQAIKDDWELGPLAPRRDVGEWAGAKGAIHESRYAAYGKVTLAMRNRRCQWAGGAYHLNITVGDRIVLIDGPDKGRIGKIKSIDYDKAEVVIDELNKSNIRVQAEIRDDNESPVVNMELPIPISGIRLVHPIKDPATGVTRDVIINQLVHGGFLHDRVSGKRRWSRIVPGLNISIPWPKKEEKEIKDYSCDTLRIDVEDKTFVPTLLRPPMPEAVLDELRNKYSRFRTRHDPEYIARLEAEAQAVADRSKLMDSMRTPLQEFHRAQREGKKKKGKPRLTQEMLEKIGEVMAKNLERTRNGQALLEAASNSGAASAETAVSPHPTETTTAAEETQPPPSST
ncbi:putative kow motif containing protein [Daldinia childiae]|uniref:putative kow motif containing protein n=1 Tax=Daldinia childiae TaxID=326645 RepID=UPI001447FF54|nr:putative kow motif containing protein [Daldinia childiae]KAF3070999.1 putative kow motif containing protein [Daldinia childiae]